MINVLFTSAGRRVELLRAFRRAYDHLQLGGNMIATDIDSLAPALQVADRPILVPRLDSPDYIPTLLDICRRESVHLIFPLIDPDIPVLARHRTAIEDTGARLAVIPQGAVPTVQDKWSTAQFFRGLGLQTPRSWIPGDAELVNAEFPLFIKPRRGSGGKHGFQVRNHRELEFFIDYVPDPVVEEFLPGPEITNDVICDLGGDVLAVVSRKRIEARWGEVSKGVTVFDSAIVEACTKIARALPAVGPITVQCMMKEGTPHFTEINARLGGGIPLGIMAGVDSPRLLLARAAGVPLSPPELGSYQAGLHLTRYDGSFFLTEAECASVPCSNL